MFIVNDDELGMLEGQAHINTCIYLYLRRHMDFKSGITGIKRGISYQSIGEALYIEPRAGVKGGSPHRSLIRRALEQMEKGGILRKKDSENLVFLLPFASSDKNGYKKADTNPTPHPDTPKPAPRKALKVQADIGKNEKADIPPISDKPIILNTTTTTKLHSTDQENAAGSSSNLIFSQRLDHDTQQSMKKLVQGFSADDQQVLIDEVQGYIERGKVKSTPLALLSAIAEKHRQGQFVANYAPKTAAGRQERKQAEIQATAPREKKLPSQERMAAFQNQRKKLG